MIKYHKQATKFIASQGKSAAIRLYRAIQNLPSGDVIRMEGRNNPPTYRLRVGDYRVVFRKEFDNYEILRIDNRGDVYKK